MTFNCNWGKNEQWNIVHLQPVKLDWLICHDIIWLCTAGIYSNINCIHFYLIVTLESHSYLLVLTLLSHQLPSIAQLVERRTVVGIPGILRSLVQIRLEGVTFNWDGGGGVDYLTMIQWQYPMSFTDPNLLLAGLLVTFIMWITYWSAVTNQVSAVHHEISVSVISDTPATLPGLVSFEVR